MLIVSISVSNKKSVPLSQAFSARAMVSPKGHTIPPVGAYNAATTVSETLGSIARTSSPVSMDNSGTPFFNPFSYRALRDGLSSSEKQRTSEPFRSKEKSRAFERSPIMRFPSVLNLAFNEPGSASYPACTMALLDFDVPEQTSSSRSMTQMFS